MGKNKKKIQKLQKRISQLEDMVMQSGSGTSVGPPKPRPKIKDVLPSAPQNTLVNCGIFGPDKQLGKVKS